jgi:hypothetical protein
MSFTYPPKLVTRVIQKRKGGGGLNRMDMLEVHAVTQCLKLSGWAVPKHANTERS